MPLNAALFWLSGGLRALAGEAVEERGQRAREHDHTYRQRDDTGTHQAEVAELDAQRRVRFGNQVHAEEPRGRRADQTRDGHRRQPVNGAALPAQDVAVEVLHHVEDLVAQLLVEILVAEVHALQPEEITRLRLI